MLLSGCAICNQILPKFSSIIHLCSLLLLFFLLFFPEPFLYFLICLQLLSFLNQIPSVRLIVVRKKICYRNFILVKEIHSFRNFSLCFFSYIEIGSWWDRWKHAVSSTNNWSGDYYLLNTIQWGEWIIFIHLWLSP